MSDSDRIPRDKQNDYSREMATQRSKFVEAMTGAKLDTVSSYTIDPAVTQGNIENFTGTAQVPLGIALGLVLGKPIVVDPAVEESESTRPTASATVQG